MDGVPTTVPSTTTAAPVTTTVPVPADVADLAVVTTMTERARRLFLAARPSIEDRTTFIANCGAELPTDATGLRTHTQGCYVGGRIHLRAVEETVGRELLYVVAAHELLHAAYASLGPADRARIDSELEAARIGNTRLDERLRPYGDGPTLINEVHSILGSEFEALSPTLETHYAQFFADRSVVVSVRRRMLGAREDEIQRLRVQVDDLDGRITTLKMGQERLRSAGEIGAYNANVATINGLIERYNAQVDALNAGVQEYNALLGG